MADKGWARWEKGRASPRVQNRVADWRGLCSAQVTLQLEVWVKERLSCCVTPEGTLPSLKFRIQTVVYVFGVGAGRERALGGLSSVEGLLRPPH